MQQANLYKEIFRRKSIRKYDLTPLRDEVLSEIKEYTNSVQRLFENIKTEIHIVKQDELNILIPVKAPHYIVLTSESKPGHLNNAGYMLQQVDLFLSSKNIGSCYLGMAMPTKATRKDLELEFVMVLAFGNPTEPVHRDSTDEFKRKQLSEITNTSNNEKLLEPARLAPSATNSQPWFFTGDEGVIHVFCYKAKLIKAIIYDKMNQIDMGIALCHIEIAAEHYGKNVEFVQDELGKNSTPKGYYYVGTMKLN